MSKIISFFVGLALLIIGIIIFVVSLIHLNGRGLLIGGVLGFLGLVLTVVAYSLMKTNSTNSTNNSPKTNVTNSKKESADVQANIQQPKLVKQESKVEKISISYSDLQPENVIQRYLTSEHNSVPSKYKFYDYLRAEFSCILNNLKKSEIKLSDEKVYRNQALFTPFEKSKNITASSRLSKLKDFISIDVETTGLKTGYNDIIEVSAIKFINFVPTEIFTTLLKPRKPIPKEATDVNGITDDMVENAPSFSQVHEALQEFIGNSNIVMHNAAFDVKFLYVSGLEFSEKQNIYCTLELSKRFIKDWDGKPLESYKLSDVCNEVSIYFDGAHRSAADALAAGLLFNEIVKIKKENVNLIEALASEG